MDETRFDHLTRAFAASSRRAMLRGIVGAVATGAGFRIEIAAAAAKRRPGEVCRKTGDCVEGATCVADATRRTRCTCLPELTTCGTACIATDSDPNNCGACGRACASGTCTGGQCLEAQGDACAAASGCASGFCVDGVCCDTACVGQCESCNLDGSVGVCTPVVGAPVGDRPPCSTADVTCAGACDGVTTASCTYPGAETVCATKVFEAAMMSPAFGYSVCDAGRCCDGGIAEVEGMRIACDPSWTGVCCTDGLSCCPGASEICCEHCFGLTNPTAGWVATRFECCPPERLCPQLSETNPRPPFCCRGIEVCVDNGVDVGCFQPEIVCDGDVVCPEKCCVAASGARTCCASSEICGIGGCVVPPAECVSDADCPAGTVCVQPGVCCSGDRVCGIPDSYGDLPNPELPRAYCCQYGQGCSEGGPTCCAYPDYLCGGPCLCTSRGSFGRY